MPKLHNVHSTGIRYEANDRHQQIPEFDHRSGEHLWVQLVMFKVDPATWEHGGQVHLDMENLVFVAPTGCFHCEEPYSARLASRRCRGKPHHG